MRECRKRPKFAAMGGVAGLMLVLAGCSESAPDRPPANGAAPQNLLSATPVAAPPKAALREAKPQALSIRTDAFSFSYKWPGAAAAIPELDTWLRANGETLRDHAQEQAATDKIDAKKNGYPFTGHSYDEEYAVAADTPAMLVLLSDGYVFTGGAHGMPINTAIIWDKATKKRLSINELVDVPRLTTLAKARFCRELDRQRAEKRGAPVNRNDPDELPDFVQCVDMAKQLILPVSMDGRELDTMRVVIGPYEAGPYVEGSYVIDLSMDKGLLAAVKPEYRGVFGG